jgi:hypothetical protein
MKKFKKRKASTVVVSSRNDTPKTDKNVKNEIDSAVENWKKELNKSQNSEDLGSDGENGPQKHVGARHRRKRGAGVKIKISKVDTPRYDNVGEETPIDPETPKDIAVIKKTVEINVKSSHFAVEAPEPQDEVDAFAQFGDFGSVPQDNEEIAFGEIKNKSPSVKDFTEFGFGQTSTQVDQEQQDE